MIRPSQVWRAARPGSRGKALRCLGGGETWNSGSFMKRRTQALESPLAASRESVHSSCPQKVDDLTARRAGTPDPSGSLKCITGAPDCSAGQTRGIGAHDQSTRLAFEMNTHHKRLLPTHSGCPLFKRVQPRAKGCPFLITGWPLSHTLARGAKGRPFHSALRFSRKGLKQAFKDRRQSTAKAINRRH